MAPLDQVLALCPTNEARDALQAKLHLIQRERDDEASAAFHRVRTAAGAGKRLGSSATATQLWEGADRESERAVGRIIDACFRVGVAEDDAIALLAAEDLENFLIAFAASRIRPSYGSAAEQLVTIAQAKAGRVRAQVTSMRFDHHQENARMSNQTITVHGGNVQVGDGNNQTVTYQTLLTNLAEAVEKSPDAPPEKKATWAATLRELAAHPLTQTLIAAAASAATGK
jgi:hypothetical protein